VYPGVALEPYYADDAVTIYHGDCRDFKSLHEADVLVTDPPYGVDLGSHGAAKDGRRHLLVKNGYASYEDTYENYLTSVVPVVSRFISDTRRAAVWVGPHYQELPKADAIGGIFNPAASGRNRWGFKTFLPVFLYGVRPNAGDGCFPTSIMSTALAERSGHPTPKPLSWMRWLVGLVSLPGETLIDPFMGSGPTLRAAKDMGRKAVGIEIEERYCEIAARQLAQEVFAA